MEVLERAEERVGMREDLLRGMSFDDAYGKWGRA